MYVSTETDYTVWYSLHVCVVFRTGIEWHIRNQQLFSLCGDLYTECLFSVVSTNQNSKQTNKGNWFRLYDNLIRWIMIENCCFRLIHFFRFVKLHYFIKILTVSFLIESNNLLNWIYWCFVFHLQNRNIMNKFLVVFVGLIVAANAVSFFDVVKEEWHAYKVRTEFIWIFHPKLIWFIVFLGKNMFLLWYTDRNW